MVTHLRKAVFLDRDGVLNQDPPHYAHRLDQMTMICGVDEAVKLLKDQGYFLVIVSNQSGVARGITRKNRLLCSMRPFSGKSEKNGGDIDAIFYGPHQPEAPLKKYRIDCDCRKPKPGMILNAAKLYDIDLQQSFFVEDKQTDVETGKNAGIRTILVLSGQGLDEVNKINKDDCWIASDLLDAVKKYIIPTHQFGQIRIGFRLSFHVILILLQRFPQIHSVKQPNSRFRFEYFIFYTQDRFRFHGIFKYID